MKGWEQHTERVEQRLDLVGWRPSARDLLRNDDGDLLWIVHPPTRRSWTPAGALSATHEQPWSLVEGDRGTELRAPKGGDVDLIVLRGPVARAFEAADGEALTVLGSFQALGPPSDLRKFLVGDEVLDTNVFEGRRYPSEQTALSIHRIARRRGGPFWDAVADHVADVVAHRVDAAAGGLPRHDVLGQGETHTRFVVDAVLLLRAVHERSGEPKWAATMQKAWGGLESLVMPYAGHAWVAHDSVERDTGENHLVLNTHIHAMVAAAALGRTTPWAAALDTVLARQERTAMAACTSTAIAAGSLVRAFGRRRVFALGTRLADAALKTAAHVRAADEALRLPGGWLARDVGLPPTPNYFTVNLADLAVLERNAPTPMSSRALRAGLRYARATGFFRGQRRAGDPLTVLVPSLMANAGHRRAAEHAALVASAAGFAPSIGWPGYEDRLWSRLAEGTP